MSDLLKKIERILPDVQKPARYIGGEWNTPSMTKPHLLNVCYCFPEVYEIGMSNLGIQILYQIANKHKDIVCERSYAPWPDMAEKMRENDIPLYSLETKTPLKEFDVLGFSIQFELLYTNILYMLDLAGIPYYAKDRDDSFPIMIAGGPCSVNPEPFAPFFDCICIGEGEEVNIKFCELVIEGKKQGLTKLEILEKAKEIDGIYVPMLHKDGEIVKKAVVKDFEHIDMVEKPLVSNIEIVHDRSTLELYRGCASGCRFCQAGFWYRPIRERSAKKLVSVGKKTIESTGFGEMSLCSLSTSDYTELEPLEEALGNFCDKNSVRLALPSLRISSFKPEMAAKSRRSSLTFAPEAGTQRLRNVINKNVSEEEIDKISVAFEAGYDSIKLYFMMGLPTETDEDLEGIKNICERLKEMHHKIRPKRFLTISVSCAVFIPKPSTPFQWEPQITMDEMLRKQNYLRGLLRTVKGVNFSWHGAESSVIEAALARGDQKEAKVIEKAYELGCKFDSWSEYFDYEKWTKAFEECGLNIRDYSGEWDINEPLPWDFIDVGVSKKYFLRERDLGHKAITTKSCREGCNGCGANKFAECTIW